MKLLVIIGCVAVFSGCISTVPDFRRDVDAHFGFTALSAFLSQLVREHPKVDGVTIETSHGDDLWLFDDNRLPVGLTSGKWTFQQSIDGKSEFYLSYRAGENTAVIFRCRCESRGKFSVASFRVENLVALSVSRIKM